MALAIFDLDETLIAGDSCTLFCEFLIAEGFAPKSFLRQDAQMMALYNSEKLVLSEYIQFLIEPLNHLSTTEIDALLPGFVEQYVVPRIYPQGLQTLADFKQQGLRPLIISATADFIVKAIAKLCDWVCVMKHGELVEQGTVRQIFLEPQQTYTQTLIASIPLLESAENRLFGAPELLHIAERPVSSLPPEWV